MASSCTFIGSPPFFPPLQAALLPEPTSRVRDAQKAVQYVFHSEGEEGAVFARSRLHHCFWGGRGLIVPSNELIGSFKSHNDA